MCGAHCPWGMWKHVFYDLHFSVHLGAVFCSYLVFFRYKIVLQSVQSLSHVQLFVMPWTAACQASLSITNSQSLLKLMSIVSVMPSNNLILCHPLLLPPPIFPSISVFSSRSVLCIRWPKYWSFSFNISPFNEHQDWSPLGWTGWISLKSTHHHQFFGAQLSL